MPESVENLRIWQEGIRLAKGVYQASSNWPKEESYGMTAQARRAAVSIPANIAEGVGRGTAAELSRYSRIALGSAYELSTLLRLARELNYLSEEAFSGLSASLSPLIRQISAFISYQEGRK